MTPEERVKEMVESLTSEDFRDLARKEHAWKIKFWGLLALVFAVGLYIGFGAGVLLR